MISRPFQGVTESVGRTSDHKRQPDSHELLRSAFEDTNVAMVLTDTSYRFVRLNAAFARLFGYSPDEMLGLSMMDVTHPDDLAESLAQREVLKSGAATHFQIEKRYLHKRGHVFWGLANMSLVHNANGEPRQYIGQIQDITERKRAAEAIVKYNERLRVLHQIDKGPDRGPAPWRDCGQRLAGLSRIAGSAAGDRQPDRCHHRRGRVADGGRAQAGSCRPRSTAFHPAPGRRGDPSAGRSAARRCPHAPPGAEAALVASGVSFYAVVPMMAASELIGALSFGGASPHFSREQIGMAREATAQFAVALLHEPPGRPAYSVVKGDVC